MELDTIPISYEENVALMRANPPGSGEALELTFGSRGVNLVVSEGNLWAIRILAEMRMPICI